MLLNDDLRKLKFGDVHDRHCCFVLFTLLEFNLGFQKIIQLLIRLGQSRKKHKNFSPNHNLNSSVNENKSKSSKYCIHIVPSTTFSSHHLPSLTIRHHHQCLLQAFLLFSDHMVIFTFPLEFLNSVSICLCLLLVHHLLLGQSSHDTGLYGQLTNSRVHNNLSVRCSIKCD